jgi:hypothetical protein
MKNRDYYRQKKCKSCSFSYLHQTPSLRKKYYQVKEEEKKNEKDVLKNRGRRYTIQHY